ncbi:MAG TPA: hypothetical protein PKN61_15875 [Acidobacteriota bacterium]|nr:hypothetical protein [Acidobacteriota bacterium]HQP75702.1 hypothetical protein [Acidobacteriota bacterium]
MNPRGARWNIRCGLAAVGMAVALTAGPGAAAAATAPAGPAEEAAPAKAPEFKFSGDYASLAPEQQRLIADWCARLARQIGKKVDPPELYAKIPISSRTTFEAVTHALIHSPLTDAAGQSLGAAIGLVDHLETVAGEVPEARGDLQFRIYVQMKPGAQETLDRCREFLPGENKRYHKGYPLSYRQDGGVPSIQISLAADGARADIDVDYRSSKIPAAIFNGHTSSANSDVRAGDNVDRHNGRWSGLADWWRNLFGLPLVKTKEAPAAAEEHVIPLAPRSGRGKIQEAVQNFLTEWLVEQRPELAMAYLSHRAYGCVPPEEPGQPVDQGMAPVRILMSMAEANRILGRPARLADVVAGDPLQAAWLKPVPKHDPALFSLYQVPDDVGEAADCAGGAAAAAAPLTGASRPDYGDFYLSAFHLKTAGARGATVSLLWTKESDYWKVVAFRREPPEAAPAATPDLRPPAAAAPALVRMPGDPAMTDAARRFFTAWLVAKDIPAAMAFFSPRVYPCLKKYLPEDAPATPPSGEVGPRLRHALADSSARVGPQRRLEEILQPVEPVLPVIGLVDHPDMAAFAILSVPDHLGERAGCDPAPQPGGRRSAPTVEAKYGHYFATSFQFRVQGGEPASIYLLWTRAAGEWTIVWLSIDTP